MPIRENPRLTAITPVQAANVCLFVLEFYGPVNPMGSCRARSVDLITLLLSRLNPLSGKTSIVHFFRQKLTTAPWISGRERTIVEKYFMINLHDRMLPTRRGRTRNLLGTSRALPTKPPRPAAANVICTHCSWANQNLNVICTHCSWANQNSLHAASGLVMQNSLIIMLDTNTVESRYLELPYFELPLISKWKSGPCFNMKIWQQVTK